MNTTTTAPRTCNLHLVKDCSTCFKFASQCDFGACRRSATKMVEAPTETRRCCDKHIKDVSRYYPTVTVKAAA